MDRTRLEDERPEAETRHRVFVDHETVVQHAGDLPQKRRDLLTRYGLALALSGLALGIRGALPVPEGTTIYQLPLVAVVLSGWLGGRGPGLFASSICIMGVWYWFIPPVNTFYMAAGYQLPFAMFIGLCLLLTEFSGRRRRTEHALRASEERFRTLVQFSFDVYWETDAQHRFTRREFSERFVDAPALNSDLGKTRWEVPYLEPDEDAWRNHRAMLDAHLPFRDFELARPTPDGGKHYFSVSGMPVFDEGGRFVGYRGVGRHITERKLAEESRRQSEAYLTEAQRLSHTGSWALDVATNRYVYTSEEFDRLFGFDPQAEAPTREAVLERMHPDDRISWKRILEKSVGEKLDTTSQYRIVLPDGGVRHIHTIRHPVVDSTGKVVKLVGTSIDITERKHAEEEHERLRRLEAELAHANRVNTLGELTTSIAHEVSQPLGAMVASAGACTRWLAADPPAMGEARAALDNIIADGKRARDVIGRIRTLTKRQPPRKERLDINREVLDVLALADRELRSQGVVPRAELDSRLPPVAADRVQLQQVLLNLIVNAIDAMSAVKDRLREVTIVSRRDGSQAVLVEVRDSGIGLDSHDVERVFDAFYTTKTEGIGIGLSISRSILEAHGGRLSASANEPHGAVFRFSLPIAKDEQS